MAFLGLRAITRWLPLIVARAIGRVVGLLAYALLGRQRALSWEHLRAAFGPRMSLRTRHRISRRMFMNLGKNALEWFVLDRFSPTRIRRLVEVHGRAHLERALAQGHGAIVLTGHFGNWELLAMAITSLGFPGAALARPLRYPEYTGFLQQMRARKGLTTFDRGSFKAAAQWLKSNKLMGVLPDQDIDSVEGVFVEFFGRPTYTPVGPAALALATGAPIIPAFMVRQGRAFRLMIEDPITVVRSEDRAQDLIRVTQAWSRVVESYIRRYPDHWVWMHRRWKTQPSPSSETTWHETPTQTRQVAAV